MSEAVFGSDDVVPRPASGDLRTDLTAWARWFLAQIAEPLRAYHPDRPYRVLPAFPRVPMTSSSRALGPPNPPRADRTHRRRYPDHAAQAPSTVGDEVFDLLVASTTIRGLTRGNEDAHAFCTRTADTLALIVAARFAADA